MVCLAIAGCVREDNKTPATPDPTPDPHTYVVALSTTAINGFDITIDPATATEGVSEGDVVTVTATPSVADQDNEFSFIGFTALPEEPVLTDTNADVRVFEFTVPAYSENGQVITITPTTAAKDKYTLGVSAIPSAAGVTPSADPATVTSDGVFATQSVELTAPAAPAGYEWVGWQHTGDVALTSGNDWTTPTIEVYITSTGATVTAEYAALPTYTLTISKLPSDISVVPTADPATALTDGVLATQSVELTAPAAPSGYEWVGWQHSGAVALVSGSDWTTQTISVYVTGTGASVTAEYKVIGVLVGSTVWAPTDVPGYFTFDEAQNACPAGWRLPDSNEISELLNDTYTTRSWTTGTGATNGLKVVLKNDPTKVIYFGNNGYKDTANDDPGYLGSFGYFWSGSTSDSDGYYLSFSSNRSAGELRTVSKTILSSVRCVKD